MTAIGFAWFFVALTFSDNEVVFAIGVVGNTLAYAILIHLLLCFPDGRLEGRLSRCVVGLTYFVTTVLQAVRFALHRPDQATAARAARKTRC